MINLNYRFSYDASEVNKCLLCRLVCPAHAIGKAPRAVRKPVSQENVWSENDDPVDEN